MKFSDRVDDFSKFFGQYLAMKFISKFFINWVVRIAMAYIVYVVMCSKTGGQ